MPENCRAPAADIIDIFIAIHVVDAGTLSALDKKRFPTNATKCAHRRIDTAWNIFEGPGKKRVRLGVPVCGHEEIA
jgi:hypothetical protein